jgi:rod shape-determining protein MreC
MVYGATVRKDDESSVVKKLQKENKELLTLLVEHKKMQVENQSLREQFEKTVVPIQQLLPVEIIGSRNAKTELIINAGTQDKVKVGNAVVVKDIVVGKVVRASPHRAVVATAAHKASTISVKTVKGNSLGLVKGAEDSLLLSNVLLSDQLTINDFVVTKGDIQEDGTGYPPNVLVGKIVSIQKKPSALFQTAEVRQIINIDRLTTVFVILSD